jgi:hypothetical protein
MYTETLRSIAGIGFFPVVSLLLFVIVFAGVVLRVLRMDETDTARLASLPLDAVDGFMTSPQEIRR